MKAKLKIDDKTYEVPLIKAPLSNDNLDKFDEDLDLLNKAIPTDAPGKLTITDVKYSVYQGNLLKSSVPSASGTVQSSATAGGNRTTENKTYTTNPVAFSSNEKASLVSILKVLAKNSHTHSVSNSALSANTGTTRIDTDEYECPHCENHANNVNKGDHCNDSGWW